MNHDPERAPESIDPALWQAYSTTVFEVDREAPEEPEPPIQLRIGEPSDPLDEVLREHGARRWAVITAWNPASKPLPRDENDARNAERAARLRARGFFVGDDPCRFEFCLDVDSLAPAVSKSSRGSAARRSHTERARAFTPESVLSFTPVHSVPRSVTLRAHRPT